MNSGDLLSYLRLCRKTKQVQIKNKLTKYLINYFI